MGGQINFEKRRGSLAETCPVGGAEGLTVVNVTRLKLLRVCERNT